jgi:hypothetical protein
MPAEARVTPIWKKQKLFVAIFLFAIAGWFFYDGKVGWPKSNEAFDAYKKFEAEDRRTEWPDFAKSRGWKVEPPHKRYGPSDLAGQYAIAGLAAVLSVITFVYWLGQKGRVVKSDTEAVYSPAGTRVPFGSITGVGKKKWEAKGLATVRYEIDGRKGEFILDDYKFERDPTHEIMAEIEAHLNPAGTPTPPPSSATPPADSPTPTPPAA